MPGGPASGWITAGEHGRELIRVPAGSHVFSNPDSERMMATSSTGKIAVTLDGSGSDRLVSAAGGVPMFLCQAGQAALASSDGRVGW